MPCGHFHILKGVSVSEIEPRFIGYDNIIMSYLEWRAISVILCKGNLGKTNQMLPAFEYKWSSWIDPFTQKGSEAHKALYVKIVNKELTSLDEFYAETDKLLKPKSRGKHLKDKKKRTSQEAFQRE